MDSYQPVDSFLYGSPYPWWEWNVHTNIVIASPRKVQMLGYDALSFVKAGYQAYMELVHPDDYERTMDAMRDLMSGRAPLYQVDYRIRAADGSYHWYMDRGAITARLENGTPRTIRGIVFDVFPHFETATRSEALVGQLRGAIPSDRTQTTVLVICSSCKQIRSGSAWLDFSPALLDFVNLPQNHGICPSCIQLLYPELASGVFEHIHHNHELA
jgi:PAS domain S-box-containing protein